MSRFSDRMRNYNSDENRARRKMREVGRIHSKVDAIMGEINDHMEKLTELKATAEKVKADLTTVSVENWKDKDKLIYDCKRQIDTMRNDVDNIRSYKVQKSIEKTYQHAKDHMTNPRTVDNVADKKRKKNDDDDRKISSSEYLEKYGDTTVGDMMMEGDVQHLKTLSKELQKELTSSSSDDGEDYYDAGEGHQYFDIKKGHPADDGVITDFYRFGHDVYYKKTGMVVGSYYDWTFEKYTDGHNVDENGNDLWARYTK
jgi:hypothetical protein